MIRQTISKLRQRENGFTIVELLIVIVVIGILAAITIVAYNGVTAKANGATARSNAETVQKVSEAYNADNSGYPSVANMLSYNGTTKLPSALVYLVSGTPTSATANAGAATTGAGIVDGTSITYCIGVTSATSTCLGTGNGTKDIIFLPNTAANGDCIGYWDYANNVTAWVYAGSATAASYLASGGNSSKIACT